MVKVTRNTMKLSLVQAHISNDGASKKEVINQTDKRLLD